MGGRSGLVPGIPPSLDRAHHADIAPVEQGALSFLVSPVSNPRGLRVRLLSPHYNYRMYETWWWEKMKAEPASFTYVDELVSPHQKRLEAHFVSHLHRWAKLHPIDSNNTIVA